MKGQGFLKVTSILMIIGGALGALAGIVAIALAAGYAALAFEIDPGTAGLLFGGAILIIVAAIVEIIAGVMGLKACKAGKGAAKCFVWGIIVAVLTVISIILSIAGGSEVNIINILLNLVVPVLYIVGAVQMKNSGAA